MTDEKALEASREWAMEQYGRACRQRDEAQRDAARLVTEGFKMAATLGAVAARLNRVTNAAKVVVSIDGYDDDADELLRELQAALEPVTPGNPAEECMNEYVDAVLYALKCSATKTGFDKYVLKRCEDPEFREALEAARAELKNKKVDGFGDG